MAKLMLKLQTKTEDIKLKFKTATKLVGSANKQNIIVILLPLPKQYIAQKQVCKENKTHCRRLNRKVMKFRIVKFYKTEANKSQLCLIYFQHLIQSQN